MEKDDNNQSSLYKRMESIKNLIQEKNAIKTARTHNLQNLKFDNETNEIDVRKTRGSYNIKDKNESHYGSNNPDQMHLFNDNKGGKVNPNEITSFLDNVKERNEKARIEAENKKNEKIEQERQNKINSIKQKASLLSKTKRSSLK